jgi:integrase
MSILQQAVSDYIKMRRTVGYKLVETKRVLPNFVAFVEKTDNHFITEKLALNWATENSSVSVYTQAKRLTTVRLFAEYMLALDPRTEVPRKNLLPYQVKRCTPYLYSDKEVEDMITAAYTLNGPIKPHVFASIIGLLAATGMRVGEVIALDRTDVNQSEGLLVVQHAKFGKVREVPLHATTVAALDRYVRLRDRQWPLPRGDSFFVSSGGTRLHRQNVSITFAELLEKAGLPFKPHYRPRIHDLRHTFAIKTLIDWYRAGLDVEAHLPSLSTYLGHTCPASTYWYLSAVPELLCLAAERLDNHMGGVS